ncbi:MAG: hypothetical protein OXM02_11870 [Bacteroidota bacterium]|nr:hypothetical protein [Bacteroidota bacterium]MDE2835199.1 hypothetical protein [Bacteroidota bacterium]
MSLISLDITRHFTGLVGIGYRFTARFWILRAEFTGALNACSSVRNFV